MMKQFHATGGKGQLYVWVLFPPFLPAPGPHGFCSGGLGEEDSWMVIDQDAGRYFRVLKKLIPWESLHHRGVANCH